MKGALKTVLPLLALAVGIALVNRGCGSGPVVEGAQSSLSRTRSSERGTFVATVAPEREPIPVNEIHSWRLSLAWPDGRPLENASIRVDGLMPAHSHGMATAPRATRGPGPGVYLVEGVKLQMPGLWTLRFTVTAGNAPPENVFFDVLLD